MLHPAEVALRRIGKQPAPGAGGHARARRPPGRAQPARPGPGQRPADRVIVDPQLGRAERHVPGGRAAGPGELPDAVDRVVIVGRQDQRGPRAERVGLPDQPARAGGVRGEDRRVLLRRRVEVREHRVPGPLDQLGRGGGGRVLRVRVPEAPAADPLGMRGQLRLGRQARAGVVEVDVPALVEVGVLGRPQPVQQRRAPVAGIRGQEAGRLWPPAIPGAAGQDGRLRQGGGHDFPHVVTENRGSCHLAGLRRILDRTSDRGGRRRSGVCPRPLRATAG